MLGVAAVDDDAVVVWAEGGGGAELHYNQCIADGVKPGGEQNTLLPTPCKLGQSRLLQL